MNITPNTNKNMAVQPVQVAEENPKAIETFCCGDRGRVVRNPGVRPRLLYRARQRDQEVYQSPAAEAFHYL